MNLINEEVNFLMCPNPLCTYKFGSSNWDCYCVDTDKNNLKKYKCPGCGFEFTVNDCQFNSIKVTGSLPNTDFVFINEDGKLLFRIAQEASSRIGDEEYITVPFKIIKQTRSMFSVNKETTEEEIEKAWRKRNE